MAEQAFSKEHVQALEKILGVKLPEQGFSLEIKPLGASEIEGAQLDGVVGGIVGPSMLPSVAQKVTPGVELDLPIRRWMAKI